jgi:hypothetical protein
MGESRIGSNIRDLVAHGIAGFEYDKARKDLDIPDGSVEVSMIAIGKRGPKGNLLLGFRKEKFEATENH